MDEAEDTNYISAKQNGRHLVDKNQFIYSLLRKRNDKAYYTCINKKKMNCKATAIVTGDKFTRKSGTHNHDTDLLKKRVRELEHQAIRAASTNHSAPRTRQSSYLPRNGAPPLSSPTVILFQHECTLQHRTGLNNGPSFYSTPSSHSHRTMFCFCKATPSLLQNCHFYPVP